MAIVKGKSFADAFTGPKSSEEILLDYIMSLCVITYDRMEELGLNQKDLAKRMGKKESQISRLLSGEANITLKTLAELDEVLKLNIKLVPLADKDGASTTSYIPPIEATGWPATSDGEHSRTTRVVTYA